MINFLYPLSVILLLSSQVGCRKIIKRVGKTAAQEGLSELAKNADQQSRQSSQKTHKVSYNELKSKSSAATKELKNYRLQCAKYKKIFDTVYTAEQFNKTNSEFIIQYNHFYHWLSKQNFKTVDSSLSYATKYNTWLAKFHQYHKSYTNAVVESQQHRIKQLKLK